MDTNILGANSVIANTNQQVDKYKEKVIDFAIANGPKIITAVVIIFIGVVVARWVDRVVQRGLSKKDMEPPIKMLISRLVKLLVIVFALVIALGTAGVDVVALVAGLSVAGVGVGLAMQGVLSNIAAGLTIIFTKPFKVGEYIELLSVAGQVKTIELTTTTLLHADLSRVVIPNRKIVGEILHNYGQLRQLDMSVGIGYRTDVDKAVAIVREILARNPRILKDPAPGIGITTLGEFSIGLAIKPWVNVSDFGPAQAEIYRELINQFRDAKIEIPLPQQEVRYLNAPQS